MGSTGRPGHTSSRVNAVRLVAASALALTSAFSAQAQETTLWSVLVRATLYVEELHAQLSGVVMEERYQQRATSPGAFRRTESAALQRATLRSDYLLVRPEGAERHFGFRDVFEANGAACATARNAWPSSFSAARRRWTGRCRASWQTARATTSATSSAT